MSPLSGDYNSLLQKITFKVSFMSHASLPPSPCTIGVVIRWWRRLFVPLEWRNTRNDFKTNCRVSDFSHTNRAQISNNFEIINLILLIVYSSILSEYRTYSGWYSFRANVKVESPAEKSVSWKVLSDQSDYSSLSAIAVVFLPIT